MEFFLVQGCGVSLVCRRGVAMLGWIRYMVARGCVPTIIRQAAQVVLLLAIVAGAQNFSHASNPQDLDQMTAYADNAILDAAQSGRKAVTLRFGNASLNRIEQLACSLRKRGYALDEQAFVLNPSMVKIRHLKISTFARRNPDTR